MLKHIVMWQLKDFAEGKTKTENALWLKTHLEALKGKIGHIKDLEVGLNIHSGEVAYDAVLVSRFEDEAALSGYKNHPDHRYISDYCKKVRENRVVVDYWEEV